MSVGWFYSLGAFAEAFRIKSLFEPIAIFPDSASMLPFVEPFIRKTLPYANVAACPVVLAVTIPG